MDRMSKEKLELFEKTFLNLRSVKKAAFFTPRPCYLNWNFCGF